LIARHKRTSNEYQLTDSLKELMHSGMKFKCKSIDEWLDCGNKEEFLSSNRKLLNKASIKSANVNRFNCKIIDPVYIGENVFLDNCTIGPDVSIENNSKITNTIIKESLIGENNIIEDSEFSFSMIGNHNHIKRCKGKVNMGDYNCYENI
jgi:glucose-1-phosphate thymidylyltransferase